MVGKLEDLVLDGGLTLIDTAVTSIVLCAAAEPVATTPSTFTVGAANVLGYKTFGAGSAFSAPTVGSPTGRKVTSTNITDGTIVTTGTASWWAAISGATLYAHNTLSAPTAVAALATFSLSPFDITIPSN